MRLSTSSLFVLALSSSHAFAPQSLARDFLPHSMIGGRGWDNQDYLSGLSGDDEDRAKATEDYQEYAQRRRAFEERQEAIGKTPQGKRFLENYQNRVVRQDEEEMPEEEIPVGSGGGSRMAEMMARAHRQRDPRQQMFGFDQKLAVPLEDDEENTDE